MMIDVVTTLIVLVSLVGFGFVCGYIYAEAKHEYMFKTLNYNEQLESVICCFCAKEFKTARCLVYDKVRTYYFDTKNDNGTYSTMRIDACKNCQDEIYAMLDEHRGIQQKNMYG